MWGLSLYSESGENVMADELGFEDLNVGLYLKLCFGVRINLIAWFLVFYDLSKL